MNYYVYIVQQEFRIHPWMPLEGNGVPTKNLKKKMQSMPVKVGVSGNLERRIEALQTANPTPLILRAKLGPFSQKQAFRCENDLHRKFRRFKLSGEWFSGKCLNEFHAKVGFLCLGV